MCVDMSQSNCSLCRSSVPLPAAFVRMSATLNVVFDLFVLRDVLLPLAPEATDIVFACVSGVPNHGGMRMLSPLSYRSKSPVTSQPQDLPCMTRVPDHVLLIVLPLGNIQSSCSLQVTRVLHSVSANHLHHSRRAPACRTTSSEIAVNVS